MPPHASKLFIEIAEVNVEQPKRGYRLAERDSDNRFLRIQPAILAGLFLLGFQKLQASLLQELLINMKPIIAQRIDLLPPTGTREIETV